MPPCGHRAGWPGLLRWLGLIALGAGSAWLGGALSAAAAGVPGGGAAASTRRGPSLWLAQLAPEPRQQPPAPLWAIPAEQPEPARLPPRSEPPGRAPASATASPPSAAPAAASPPPLPPLPAQAPPAPLPAGALPAPLPPLPPLPPGRPATSPAAKPSSAAATKPSVPARPRPPAAPAVGPAVASIEVDLGRQQLTAMDAAGRVVLRRAVSTGLPRSPTPTGRFQVAGKYARTTLTGRDYRIEGVRHVMCLAGPGLRPDAICLHPAPWQEAAGERFGVRRSHGCVRLPSATALWLFQRTAEGTPVRIRP
jgi:lipoprotein-anchoring transpeptidase ErfK/SrfK